MRSGTFDFFLSTAGGVNSAQTVVIPLGDIVSPYIAIRITSDSPAIGCTFSGTATMPDGSVVTIATVPTIYLGGPGEGGCHIILPLGNLLPGFMITANGLVQKVTPFSRKPSFVTLNLGAGGIGVTISVTAYGVRNSA